MWWFFIPSQPQVTIARCLANSLSPPKPVAREHLSAGHVLRRAGLLANFGCETRLEDMATLQSTLSYAHAPATRQRHVFYPCLPHCHCTRMMDGCIRDGCTASRAASMSYTTRICRKPSTRVPYQSMSAAAVTSNRGVILVPFATDIFSQHALNSPGNHEQCPGAIYYLLVSPSYRVQGLSS